jgi:hypothetical protein
MKYGSSAEMNAQARKLFVECRSAVERHIEKALATSPLLADLTVKILYVPIIMPEEMHARYKSRTRIIKNSKTLAISPHLDYLKFTEGSLDECVVEYLRGIDEATHLLSELGMDCNQINAVKGVLQDALTASKGNTGTVSN